MRNKLSLSSYLSWICVYILIEFNFKNFLSSFTKLELFMRECVDPKMKICIELRKET